ncbi:alpha-L-rhamnosidase [Arthrobacter sp. MDB2-24]
MTSHSPAGTALVKNTSFITAPFRVGDQDGDPAPYFRRDFEVEPGLQRATLRVTAIGVVDPHLNGARVGAEVLAPGWTSYRHRLNVSSHDVTALLTEGTNTVGAVVGEGWALGTLGFHGKRNHYSDKPGLLMQLDLDYGDRVKSIETDERFTVGTGGVRGNSLYDGEHFDARLEPTGWDAPGFDDTDWQAAVAFTWDTAALVDPVGPPIARTEELRPAEIITTPSGNTVVDFGQNISGWVRLSAEGDAGTVITLRHAEVMTDGEIDTETIRTAKATDSYTLAGTGTETWEPRFTFHGFRYAEINGYPGTLTKDAVTAVVVHSDMRRTGWFSTSDELINQLHSNVVWSMRDNFVGVPTDCPQRDERLGWTGDINAFGPTASFLYDVRGMLGSWLEDVRLEQTELGGVPFVIPDVLNSPVTPTALWGDVIVSLPWTMYQQYGDLKILRTNYDAMRTFITDVESRLDETGLWGSGYQFGDWLDPDAPMDNPSGGKTDSHLVASAYFCKTTREMADTADLLGHAEDAARFRDLNARVRAAFQHEYVSGAGRIVNESATAYALAISFGILDGDQKQRAGERLAALTTAAGYKISTGFAGTPLVTDALTSTGQLDTAYRLLMQTECPSFLYPVTMGATTIWERWDSVRPDGTINPSGMTSLNHYALGAVADWMHRVVGGLSALEAGYQKVLIAPKPGGGLTHASTSLDTDHGPISVDWRISDGAINLIIDLPAGVTAQVELPLSEEPALEVPAGQHTWTYDLPAGFGQRPVYNLDSSLSTIAADPEAWRALTTALAAVVPGIPLDGQSADGANITVNDLVGTLELHVPNIPTTLRATLADALTSGALEGSH